MGWTKNIPTIEAATIALAMSSGSRLRPTASERLPTTGAMSATAMPAIASPPPSPLESAAFAAL